MTDPSPPAMLCADIGGSFLSTALVAADGSVAARERVATPTRDLDAFVAVLAQFAARHDPAGRLPFGLSLAGVIDPASETVLSANIPCLNGCALAGRLRDTLARPIGVANDADCFALGEALHGAGRGRRIVFGIVLGSGVGGGLVVDGRLIVGEGGLTGEWGHGPVLPPLDGVAGALPSFPCGCGQTGCLDPVGGARGLERLHRHLHGVTLDSRAIVAAWSDGDGRAGRTIALQIEIISRFLAMVINVVGAAVVPVGGALGTVTPLVARLDQAVRGRIVRPTSSPLVVPALRPADAPLLGAAHLASGLHRAVADPA